MSDGPRVLAVANGPPFDRLTWSGISFHFLSALERAGATVVPVDGRTRWLERAEQLGSYSLTSDLRWRQRYHAKAAPISPLVRLGRTAVAAARARGAGVDAVVQVGTWYDVTRLPQLRGAVRCTFQDGNLMTFLRRPDLQLDPASRGVRRAMAREARLQRRMDLVFTMSEWVRRSMVDDYGLEPGRVLAVGAGPNLDTLPERAPRAPAAPFRILFVGKRFDRKGGFVLLEAFRRLRAAHPDAELWIVGPADPVTDDPGVRHFGLIRRDSPAGDAELTRLYREASVFALPSIYEPFGISFLEAMAYGLPCVGSDACAMPEIIEDGVTGHVITPGDAPALAAALERLAADPAGTVAMGGRGRARLEERYTWDGVAGRVLAAIDARRRP